MLVNMKIKWGVRSVETLRRLSAARLSGQESHQMEMQRPSQLDPLWQRALEKLASAKTVRCRHDLIAYDFTVKLCGVSELRCRQRVRGAQLLFLVVHSSFTAVVSLPKFSVGWLVVAPSDVVTSLLFLEIRRQ